MDLRVQVQGQNGPETLMLGGVPDAATLGDVRQRLAAQGLQLIRAGRVREAGGFVGPPNSAQPITTAQSMTETATTTTPHPWMEAAGTGLGSTLLTPLGPAGRVAGGAAGAVAARALAERRIPTTTEAGRAAFRGGVGALGGEALTKAVGLVPRLLVGRAPRVATDAIGRLGTAVTETNPATLKVIRDASGKLASLAKTLQDPANATVHAASRETLVRGWFQLARQGGRQGMIEAFDALTKKEAANLFGPMLDDVTTLIGTLRTGHPLSGANMLRGLFSYGVGGLPLAATIGAANVTRSQVVPRLIGRAISSPEMTRVVGRNLPRVIEGTANLSRAVTGALGAGGLSTLSGGSRLPQKESPR